MSDRCAYSLASVGYLIVSEPISPSNYRGVDRIPQLFPPDRIILKHIGEPLPNNRLQRILEEWFTHLDAGIPFIASRGDAIRFLTSFKETGLKLELLFCQLAGTTSESERFLTYPRVNEDCPVFEETYGFDVSWPSCNHSAIIQPGVVPSNQEWLARLNRWELFDNFKDAAELRGEYLNFYPYPPFDIFRVHKVALQIGDPGYTG